ncbi:hypothetical protein ACOME3_010541 [Neoechinorhynchus agilis]
MTSELEDDVELKEEKDVLLVVKQLKSQKFPKSVREALSLDESFENAFDLISSHFKSTTEIDLTEYLKLSDSGTFSKCLKEISQSQITDRFKSIKDLLHGVNTSPDKKLDNIEDELTELQVAV